MIVLWAVVNNAGIFAYVPIEWGHDADLLETLLSVNVLGVVRVTKACLPLLRLSGGRVVTMASTASHLTVNNFTAYSMTKHAVRAFIDGLRREMKRFGVDVIAIEPSIYRTPMADKERNNIVTKREWSMTSDRVKEDYGGDDGFHDVVLQGDAANATGNFPS